MTASADDRLVAFVETLPTRSMRCGMRALVASVLAAVACGFAPPYARVRRPGAAGAPARGAARGVGGRTAARAVPLDVDQQSRLVNDFVTQRAVQTLLYLLRLNRDEVTANWLHRFANHTGVEHFHGTRGLKLAWDDYVAALLTADTESIVVSLRKRGGRGLSPGNPYAAAEQWFNYTVDIFPRDLGERVLALRSAVAAELRNDLGALGASQAEFLRSYRAAVRNGTDPAAGHAMPAALEGYDAAIGTGDATPYRAGTYDLALRLAGHQAVLRRAAALDVSASREDAYAASFLRDFFAKNGAGFDGDGPNGVAISFFRKLLEAEPRVKRDGADQRAVLLDPPAIAEDLIADQRAVADLWRDAILPDVDRANAYARRRALEASFSTLPDP